MEDSFGKYGVQLDSFGPYELPGRQYQYFLTDQAGGNNPAHCPALTPAKPCTGFNFRTDARAAWLADVGAAKIAEYDNVFYVSAGEDESSTWQEFGEMKWMTKEDVPDAFGPKVKWPLDTTQTNWAVSRYVPWSSWASASTNWPNASGNTSVEAESSGMGTFAHELSHNLSIPDNYSNPYAPIQQRGFTGMWDMMSRGSFNGPGGPHTRYIVPPTTGGSLGSQHDIRNKLKLGFVTPDQVLRLTAARCRTTASSSPTSRRARSSRATSWPECRSRWTARATTRPRASWPPTGSATASPRPPTAPSATSTTRTRPRSCSRSARTPSTRATA
jgi:M6 family metalloprotease-like protein